jgi:uncharacterized membrane protein YfcA
MEPAQFAVAALILFLAYLIRGISGFGSALVAVPLLAHLFSLQFVVPLVVALDLLASLALSAFGWRRGHIRWAEAGWLMPASLAGIAVGVLSLVHLPQEPLLLALGLFVIAFGVRNLLDLHGGRIVSRWWALPAGFTGGAIGALFATGGPPFVIYLSHRLRDKAELRATFSGLFLVEGSLRLLSLALAGLLLQEQMGVALLIGLPAMAAGIFVGHHVHLGLSQRQMLVIIGLLLIGSGGSLLWRAL